MHDAIHLTRLLRLQTLMQRSLNAIDQRLDQLETNSKANEVSASAHHLSARMNNQATLIQNRSAKRDRLQQDCQKLRRAWWQSNRVERMKAEKEYDLNVLESQLESDFETFLQTCKAWVNMPFDQDPAHITRAYLQQRRTALVRAINELRRRSTNALLNRLRHLPPAVLCRRLRSLLPAQQVQACLSALLQLRAAPEVPLETIEVEEDGFQSVVDLAGSAVKAEPYTYKISCPVLGQGRIPYRDKDGHRRYHIVQMDGTARGSLTVRVPKLDVAVMSRGLAESHRHQTCYQKGCDGLNQPSPETSLAHFLDRFRAALEASLPPAGD